MNPSWLWLDSGPQPAPFNMAMDEALLLSMPRLNLPVLRFYAWTRPAASFGYFQRYSDVQHLTPLRPLVRRPTAGGIVPHDADWTYSLAIPVSNPWYQLKAVQSYLAIHQWLQAAFLHLGIPTRVAGSQKKDLLGQCFVGHELHDLLWRDRKIAGAAQRRTRSGLLIQGSVQPPPTQTSRAAWQSAMLHTGSTLHHARWSELPPDSELHAQTLLLTQTKYSHDEYNQKR